MTKDSDFKKLVRERMAATGQSYTAARAAIYRPAAAADPTLTRRAFGLKTWYTAAFDGGWSTAAGTAGELLFRQVAGRGMSALVYLENGAGFRLRPDESGAARPAYATPECDSIVELVAAQRAGEEIVARAAVQAGESLTGEDPAAAPTMAAVATAQSESYLVAAPVAAESYRRLLEPFLATRWVCGGRRADGSAGAVPAPWAVIAAKSFADEGRYRRLKIAVADPSPSELATFVRVAATEQVLRLAESASGVSVGVSVDHGRDAPALDAVRIQRAYLAAARRARYRRPEDDIILDAWQAALDVREDARERAAESHPDSPIVTAAQIEAAVDRPPQTTRARLRGLFIKTAKDYRRNFTVDWTHLKLHDGASRTVLCRDPLNAEVESAERLIASISGPPVDRPGS